MKEFIMQMIALKLAEGEVVRHDKTFAQGMHTKHLYFLAAIYFVTKIETWWASTTQLNYIRAGYNRSAFCEAMSDLHYSPYVHCVSKGKRFVSAGRYEVSYKGIKMLEKFIAVQEFAKKYLDCFGHLDIFEFTDIPERTVKYMDSSYGYYSSTISYSAMAKYVSYRLAIKDYSKTYKLNKRDIHLLLCLRYVTGVAKLPMAAKVIIPIKGRVNVSSIYKSLKKYVELGLVNKYDHGACAAYDFTDKGREYVEKFRVKYEHYFNYFTAPPETAEEKAKKFREGYEAAVKREEEKAKAAS